ncbi:SpoIIE family protein phosphatase [Streptacidiphilus fuscans]|uniref:protein-serine/threonine phosphatase n=1 Tax=Streptacidiphilus fuscans TaxID=2789292 RepID=A0A931FEZ0_9ACTN|nr:SpoIIE family protein phosphatase [Streptacidiphilus fuscans]MBF9069216.1 SpoIIE family protein phosphatase [Streptacidiphilus fuscans]
MGADDEAGPGGGPEQRLGDSPVDSAEVRPADGPGESLLEPGGLLDVLGVAAVVLDDEGRIVLWSPQAEQLYGYSPAEALGRPALQVLVAERDQEQVMSLFAQVMAGGGAWAGAFPVRRKDGATVLAEFRNMRLEDEQGRHYALGLASDRSTLRHLERGLALSMRLVEQSPIGLAVVDTDLRYVLVNPALERINGLPAAKTLGRTVRESLPFVDTDVVESAMREVLATGTPILDRFTTGRTPADDSEHAWSASYYRLEDTAGHIIGVAVTVVDVTDQHRTAAAASAARRRLTVLADASERIGTTLDLDQTARELAEVLVPEFADIAAVDVLDSVLNDVPTSASREGESPSVFRALAIKAAGPTPATLAADPVGQIAKYDATRLVSRCARTGRPVLLAHVTDQDLPRIARDRDAVGLLKQAGVHSYLAVPLRARGQVLGALDLKRARNPEPFTQDDAVFATELAARAAVAIDNARWYQRQRHAALTLQRHLLPGLPPPSPGLEVAYRYQPASVAGEVGGDWFDVIPLAGSRTALVVGDVMGSGINAAASMGQLRTAARTLASLELDPAAVLTHLDRTVAGLDETIATCVYAVYDPHRSSCTIATAGHLPPVHTRLGHPPRLLELPTGAPLGAGVPDYHDVRVKLGVGDELLLYTDGLVETRDHDIDTRLRALTDLLDRPHHSLEETCDLLLSALAHHGGHDDVALLLARTRPLPSPPGPRR